MAIPIELTQEKIEAKIKAGKKYRIQNRNGAKSWAKKKCYVLPLVPGNKMPYKGCTWKMAAITETEVDSLWDQYPLSLIGLINGPSGKVTFDFDKKHGGLESYEKLKKLYPVIMNTYIEQTRGRGIHSIFNDMGLNILTSTDTFKLQGYPGIDIRGSGGLTAVAPSIDETGEYIVLNDVPFADLPDCFKDMLEKACAINKPELYDSRPVPVITVAPNESLYPACIVEMLRVLRLGVNHGRDREHGLSHNERLTLATFLLNIGFSQDKIVDIFRSAPDFNEKTTVTQVKWLSDKKYNCPKCTTMQAWNICPDSSKCRIGSPLYNYIEKIGIQPNKIKREPAKSLKEFLLSKTPVEMWTIKKVLLRRCLKVNAGESKSGKSTVAYVAAAAIASGKPFLNHSMFEIMDKGPVMFIDGENSERYIKRQLIRAQLSLGILSEQHISDSGFLDPDKPEILDNVNFPDIYIYGKNYQINFKEPEGMAFIESEIQRIKPAWVFWDSFYTFFTGDVKEEKDVLPILNEFSRWQVLYDCGIDLTVHFNKGAGQSTKKIDINRISGTKVFGNWFETAWLVSNPYADQDEPEDDGTEDDDLDDFAGQMTINLRCLFRESGKKSFTVKLKMRKNSCDIIVEKNISKNMKNIEPWDKKKKIDYPYKELKNFVIRHMLNQPQPDEYLRCKTELSIDIRADKNNFSIKRDDLKSAINRMYDEHEFKIVNISGGERLGLHEKHIPKIEPNEI